MVALEVTQGVNARFEFFIDGRKSFYRPISDMEKYMATSLALSVIASKDELDKMENSKKPTRQIAREVFSKMKFTQFLAHVNVFTVYYGIYEFERLPYNPYEAIPLIMKHGSAFISNLATEIDNRSGYGQRSEKDVEFFREQPSSKGILENKQTKLQNERKSSHKRTGKNDKATTNVHNTNVVKRKGRSKRETAASSPV